MKPELPDLMKTIPSLVLSVLILSSLAAPALGEDTAPPLKEGASVVGKPGENPLYTVKFEGGRMAHFAELWKKGIPSDSIVMTESAERPRLPAFEIRYARLDEVARSVAFLSDGALTIEVVEGNQTTPRNIWRIGTAASKAASVKMRAVAAPNLFASEERVKSLLEESAMLEQLRLRAIEEVGRGDG